MKKLILIIVLAVAGYAAYQQAGIYSDRAALTKQAEARLDKVGAQSHEAIRDDLVREAARVGIVVRPNSVQVSSENADVQSLAQKFVSKTGMQFQNQRVTIRVIYQAKVLGIVQPQEIVASKIRQVSVTPPAPQRDVQEMLDSTR